MTSDPEATTLRVRAYAKVNLALEILGRRPDGYHEIVSVVQTISLHDLVAYEPTGPLRVETEPPLVEEHANLARRAAEAYFAATGRPEGGRLRVEKRIPLAAGLGGGSSDAAATLRLLQHGARSGPGRVALDALAATLGADVALFLTGGATLIRGRGEIVEALLPPPTYWLALACPTEAPPDKTRALYGALRSDDWTDGAATLALAEQVRAGRGILESRLVNGFDRAAATTYPHFVALRAKLEAAAGVPLHLTGAGPSLFGLFPSQAEATLAARRMGSYGLPTFAARSVGRPARVRRGPADRPPPPRARQNEKTT